MRALVSVGDDTYLSTSSVRGRDPLLGTRVGDYRVEEVVGSGSMGIVYRGVHDLIGKTVAIKVLKAEIADDPDMVSRLVREARTVNAIRHPGIVDIFGFGNLPSGQPYVVMDLLEGEPLDLWIRREAPAPATAVVPIIDELLSALGAAHDVGVIHRDLKPGNVFLETGHEGNARLKLLDFGLARQADRAQGSVRPTNPGTLLGTPAFMAPEQVMGQKVSPASDLYAVGGIAYNMLTGHLAHEAPSAVEVLSAKMLNDPIRPRQWRPDLDEELERWVLTLLQRDPLARPATATETRRQLRAIAERLSGMPRFTPTPAPQAIPGSSPSGFRASSGSARGWQDAKTVLSMESVPAPDLTPPSSQPLEARTVLSLPVGDDTQPPTPMAGSPAVRRPPSAPAVIVQAQTPAPMPQKKAPPSSPVLPQPVPLGAPSTKQESTSVINRGPTPSQQAAAAAAAEVIIVPRSNGPLIGALIFAALVLAGVVYVLFFA